MLQRDRSKKIELSSRHAKNQNQRRLAFCTLHQWVKVKARAEVRAKIIIKVVKSTSNQNLHSIQNIHRSMLTLKEISS